MCRALGDKYFRGGQIFQTATEIFCPRGQNIPVFLDKIFHHSPMAMAIALSRY